MRLAITGRLEQWPEQKPFDKRKHVPLQFIEISDTLGVTLIPALSPEKTADDIAGICDGLILSGTLNDIHPSYYGEEPAPGLKYEIDEYAGDRSLILAFSAENKPILGICGGLQSINVTFGGTLHQHIDGPPGHSFRRFFSCRGIWRRRDQRQFFSPSGRKGYGARLCRDRRKQ